MATSGAKLRALRADNSLSESAAKIKLFFVPLLLHSASADTLQAAGAEDKPLLGSKLSADSGAKTRLGFGKKN